MSGLPPRPSCPGLPMIQVIKYKCVKRIETFTRGQIEDPKVPQTGTKDNSNYMQLNKNKFIGSVEASHYKDYIR